MVLFQQMIVLFIIMIVGFISCKQGIITEEVSKKLSSLVVNIANPCLIVSSVLGQRDSITSSDLLQSAIAAVAIFIALIALAEVIPLLLRIPKGSLGAYKAMTIFSNIGFMGFPIISTIYGSEALLFASIFILPYNILIYTYGIKVMKQSSQKQNRWSLRLIFNNGVIACIITLILFLTNLTLPVFASSSIKMLSELTAPVSMMVIGASFASFELKKIFTNYKLLIFSLIKLLLIPILGLFILKLFIHNNMLLGVCMVMLATPVGSMVPMLAQEYQGDYQTGAEGVAVTTLLSVLTISFVSMAML